VRTREGRRLSIPLSGVAAKSDEAADERALLVAGAVAELVDAHRGAEAKALGAALGRATSPIELAEARAAVAQAVEEGKRPKAVTVRQFAERWTGGGLAREFPDQVKAIDQGDNVTRFERYVFPLLGRRAIGELMRADGDKVMARLPAGIENRRAIAQTLYRLARLAVYVGLLARSPFPVGWLPRLAPLKGKPFLYPDEDAALLGCTAIPLRRRVAYGLLDREGFRPAELVGRRGKRGAPAAPPMGWDAIDLLRGVVRLDVNKTADPRPWSLDPGVARALRAWHTLQGDHSFMVGELVGVDDIDDPYVVDAIPKLAEHLRADLKTAGVTRAELWDRTRERSRLRAHDLRGTFVTLSLANGKTETWVADRTGHKSSAMIYRYRRAARTAAELGLGPLLPMDEAIPELRAAATAGGPGAGKTRRARSKTG